MADAGVEQLKQSSLLSIHPSLTCLEWATVWESKAKKSISMFGLGIGVISKTEKSETMSSRVAKGGDYLEKGGGIASFL